MERPNTPKDYMRRPYRVEAFRVSFPMETACSWLADAMDQGFILVYADHINLYENDDVQRAVEGDWIVNAGEHLSVWSDADFTKNYYEFT